MITLAIPAYNKGFTGCFWCQKIWTRACRIDLAEGSLFQCDECGKEYMQVNDEGKGLRWEPTMTVLKASKR